MTDFEEDFSDSINKSELTIFNEFDYQNLVVALEVVYYEYWNLLDRVFQQRCEKEIFRLVDRLYNILTEKKQFNKSPCSSIGDLELLLIIINEELKLKINIDLQNAQKPLVDFFNSFYGQFDIIVDSEE